MGGAKFAGANQRLAESVGSKTLRNFAHNIADIAVYGIRMRLAAK